MSLPDPSKPPTPAEYSVIAVGASLLFIGVGLVGLGFGFFGRSHNPEIAAVLMRCSGWSLAIGILIGFAFWLVRRLTD